MSDMSYKHIYFIEDTSRTKRGKMVVVDIHVDILLTFMFLA